jgi:hypothetical protein
LELNGDTLLDLVDEEFGVGIHVPHAFLESGKVVGGRRIQDEGSDTRMLTNRLRCRRGRGAQKEGQRKIGFRFECLVHT